MLESKEVWELELIGIGGVRHSEYLCSMSMNVDKNKNHIIISGIESSGKFYELIDMESGKTVSSSILRDGIFKSTTSK